ncbi:MAG: ATP-grasp domain-containing protein [Candidatus Lambdaproteobacteria bacterium]|nr:ATP-grasp domain-containing protein [Candidatus Lambdaproteobacteria bacterium]
MRIGLTYDLQQDYLAQGYSLEDTAEFDAPETIAALETALRELGHQPERIGNIRALVPRLAAGQRWELVFNIAEGLRGFAREAQVPALLEAYDIPCVFSDPVVLALALHKGLTKRLVRDAGVATPDFAVVNSVQEAAAVNLPYPLFAKPVAEGTSKGITRNSRVNDRDQLIATCATLLERFRQPVLVETFMPGREFTVGILGSGQAAERLGVLEVRLADAAEQGMYSFHNKEHYESLVEYHLVREPVADEVSEVALAAWRVLECRDAGRVDIRLDAQGRPNFIEVNPLAGLHPVRSDLVILARKVGLDYTGLIGRIMASALERLEHAPFADPSRAVSLPETAHAGRL